MVITSSPHDTSRPIRAECSAECPEAVGQVFNVGSTQEISILDLARRVLALVDRQQGGPPRNTEKWIRLVSYDEAYGPGFEDMQRRVPDIAKIGRYVGWQIVRSYMDKSGASLNELLAKPGEELFRESNYKPPK